MRSFKRHLVRAITTGYTACGAAEAAMAKRGRPKMTQAERNGAAAKREKRAFEARQRELRQVATDLVETVAEWHQVSASASASASRHRRAASASALASSSATGVVPITQIWAKVSAQTKEAWAAAAAAAASKKSYYHKRKEKEAAMMSMSMNSAPAEPAPKTKKARVGARDICM